jgi:hypothetical protein
MLVTSSVKVHLNRRSQQWIFKFKAENDFLLATCQEISHSTRPQTSYPVEFRLSQSAMDRNNSSKIYKFSFSFVQKRSEGCLFQWKQRAAQSLTMMPQREI